MRKSHNRQDITGRTFGRLIVAGYSHTNHNRKAMWNCTCECGNSSVVMGMRLISGHTQSCGCLGKERGLERLKIGHALNYKHGAVGTPTYASWASAKERCFNPNNHNFPIYGGLGITMCERWRESFSNFLADMGERPSMAHTIDRFPDRDGDYEPGNCRWATVKEQANNRRSGRYFFFGTGPIPVSEAIEMHGAVNLNTALRRIREGWDLDDAVLTPPGEKPQHFPIVF